MEKTKQIIRDQSNRGSLWVFLLARKADLTKVEIARRHRKMGSGLLLWAETDPADRDGRNGGTVCTDISVWRKSRKTGENNGSIFG